MRSGTVVVVMIAMLVAAPAGVSAEEVAGGSRVRVKTAGSKSVGTVTEQRLVQLEKGSEAWSQEGHSTVAQVVVGSRIRVNHGQVQGTVMAMDEDSFVISADDKPLRVSREAITQLEVSTGRHGNALKGLLIGAGSGAALFAATPSDEYCRDLRSGETCPTKAEWVGIGVLGGAIWGVLIGHLIKSDRWVSVENGAQITLTLPRRGIGAQLSVGW